MKNSIFSLVGGLKLNNKVLGGVIIIFVMVVGVTIVMFFNSTNPNTLGGT